MEAYQYCPLLRLEFAGSRELAEVIDGRVEQRCQLFHRQEVHGTFHASLQVQIKSLFHGEPDKVDQRGILAEIRPVQGLDIARAPFSEDKRRWIALLHEHQVEQQPPNPAVAINYL